MKIKLALFDFDGTMLNSTEKAMGNHQNLARESGIQVPSLELLKEYWGSSWLDLVNVLAKKCNWSEKEKNFFIERYSQLSKSEMRYDFFPDVKEVLFGLREQGIKVAILSSRVRESKKVFSILNYLDFAGIDKNLFTFIQGVEDCPFLKPDPRVFLPIVKHAQRLSISQDEIVYVGDTVKYDFVPANKSPIDFMGMVSGASEKEDFMKVGVPEIQIIKSLSQVLKVIKKCKK